MEAEMEVRGAAIMAKAEGTAKAATRGAVAEGWVRPRVRAAGSMGAGGMGPVAKAVAKKGGDSAVAMDWVDWGAEGQAAVKVE